MTSIAKSPPSMFTLVMLSGLSILSLNMFVPSLSNMAHTFQADYALVNLSIAGYLTATAALHMIIGPLSDRFGRRPVMLWALVIFIIASIGCFYAQTIWVFLGFRLMQGAIVAGIALSTAIVRDMMPPQEAASKIGYVTMAMALAPMLGPVLGGALDEMFGWRSNFMFFIGVGAGVFALTLFDLGETHTERSDNFLQQLKTYPELLTSRRFWGYASCMAFSVGAFYSFLAGAPLVAETLFSISTGELGIYIGSISGGFMFGNFLSGRYAKRTALTTLIIAGRLSACGGLILALTLYLSGFVHVYALFGPILFVGIGNGLTLPGCNAGALSVRPKLAGSAAGLMGALTVGGGGIVTSFTGSILTPENGALVLLGGMLVCSALGLVAALYVRHINKLEGEG